MNTKDIENRLRALAAGKETNPELEAAIDRQTSLTAQLAATDVDLAAAHATSDALATSDATALAAGRAGDEKAVARAAAEVQRLTAARERLVRAVGQLGDQIEALTRQESARVEALLRPIFASLLAELEASALATAKVDALLSLAHDVALNRLPSHSSSLQAGYGGLVSYDRLAHWRARAEAAGLLPRAERVA
jgi:hypothetical protein